MAWPALIATVAAAAVSVAAGEVLSDHAYLAKVEIDSESGNETDAFTCTAAIVGDKWAVALTDCFETDGDFTVAFWSTTENKIEKVSATLKERVDRFALLKLDDDIVVRGATVLQISEDAYDTDNHQPQNEPTYCLAGIKVQPSADPNEGPSYDFAYDSGFEVGELADGGGHVFAFRRGDLVNLIGDIVWPCESTLLQGAILMRDSRLIGLVHEYVGCTGNRFRANSTMVLASLPEISTIIEVPTAEPTLAPSVMPTSMPTAESSPTPSPNPKPDVTKRPTPERPPVPGNFSPTASPTATEGAATKEETGPNSEALLTIVVPAVAVVSLFLMVGLAVWKRRGSGRGGGSGSGATLSSSDGRDSIVSIDKNATPHGRIRVDSQGSEGLPTAVAVEEGVVTAIGVIPDAMAHGQ